jgi:hypothetical protein
VDSDVGGDVIALDCRSTTVAPLTRKVEVVGAFAADMAFAHVVLKYLLASGVETKAIHRVRQADGMHTYIEEFGAVASFTAALPLTGEVVNGRAGVLHGLHGRRRLADELLSLLRGGLLLLGGSSDGLSDGLRDVHREVCMFR